MSAFRFAAVLAVVVAPIIAIGPPAAAAVVPLCTYEVTRVLAVNIQERNADEVYVELGDERFPRLGGVRMEQGVSLPGSSFNSPEVTSSFAVQLNLWEYDGVLLPDDALGGTTLPCVARAERPVQVIRTAEIEYIVWVRVTSHLP